MVIGIVLSSLLARGTEKQALRLSQYFVKNGHTVIIFSLYQPNQRHLLNEFEKLKIEIIDLTGFSKYKIFHFIEFLKAIRKSNCEVLLSRVKLTNKITGLAGWILGIPTAIVLSGAIFKKEVNNTLFRGAKVFYNLGWPSKIISVSKQGAENFIYRHPFLKNRVTYILNGIEKIEVQNNPTSTFELKAKFNFCYTGSLVVYRKGLDVLLNATKQMSDYYSSKEINLILIGSGSDEIEIKNMVFDLGISDYIVFAGEQSVPYEIMTRCDVFVLPSRKEGLPNALLEAMSLGLPSISADCVTGPNEIITDNQDGILVPVEDVNALANAMDILLRDKNFASKLGENGRQRILKDFSVERMSNQYLELLQGISKK
jgi:GalNAc-alpha-(1->4)-GalNAc-alpha-(1->3)-diNAcBac-PP-undecaprenol alpha-1,4-N-acetyl-D-galactosaminyltransferase